MKDFLKSFIKKETLFVIVLFAIALRFIAINQSLWLDEAIGALVVKNQSYGEILTKFPLADNHPPLYYLTLKFWTDLYGYSEVALRSLSVLFGALTVVFIYKIAEVVASKKKVIFPILSALLLATSPLHIYYSQEARMYVMAGFLAAAAIYYFLRTIKEKAGVIDWILFSIFYTALIFTDYVPIFLYPVFPIYALLKKKGKGWWSRFILANIPLAITSYFWAPIFFAQSKKGGWLLKTLPAWKSVAGGATVKQAALVWMKFVLGRISFINKFVYYSLVLVASISYAVSLLKSVVRKKDKLDFLNLWLILPLVTGFVASFWFPAFIYFRFIFVLPAFYLLTAKGVDSLKSPFTKWILASALITVNFVGFVIYVGDKDQQREEWRQAVSFVEERAGEKEVVIFENPEPFAPYRWYTKGQVEAVGVTDSISANKEGTKNLTREAVSAKEGVYYFPYLADLSDPEGYVEETLKEEGFLVVEEFSFRGLGQIKYYKSE